jgi:hypothetical protein
MECDVDQARKRRDDFLKRAAEAESRAETAADHHLRKSWLECAQAWRYLGERAVRGAG